MFALLFGLSQVASFLIFFLPVIFHALALLVEGSLWLSGLRVVTLTNNSSASRKNNNNIKKKKKHTHNEEQFLLHHSSLPEVFLVLPLA